MKKLSILALVCSGVLLTGCAHHTYGGNSYRNTVTGAALGAAGGALVGNAVDPYNGVYYGAAAGTVLGGGIGYVMDKRRHRTREDRYDSYHGGYGGTPYYR